MKDKILKWLEKINLGSEEVAEILQISEPEALDYLKSLIDQGLIRLINHLKYQNYRRLFISIKNKIE